MQNRKEKTLDLEGTLNVVVVGKGEYLEGTLDKLKDFFFKKQRSFTKGYREKAKVTSNRCFIECRSINGFTSEFS